MDKFESEENAFGDTYFVSRRLGRGREMTDSEFCACLEGDLSFYDEAHQDFLRCISLNEPWATELERCRSEYLNEQVSSATDQHAASSGLQAQDYSSKQSLAQMLRGLLATGSFGGVPEAMAGVGRLFVAQFAFTPTATAATLNSPANTFSAGPFEIPSGFTVSLGAKPAPLGKWRLTCIVESTGVSDVHERPFRLELIIGQFEDQVVLEGSIGAPVSATVRIRSGDGLQIYFEWRDDGTRD